MFISTNTALHFSHMLRLRDFKGPKHIFFHLKYLEKETYFEKRYKREDAKNNVLTNMLS